MSRFSLVAFLTGILLAVVAVQGKPLQGDNHFEPTWNKRGQVGKSSYANIYVPKALSKMLSHIVTNHYVYILKSFLETQ